MGYVTAFLSVALLATSLRFERTEVSVKKTMQIVFAAKRLKALPVRVRE